MSVTLLFPPPFDISQPYLSLPMLAGFLRRQGIEVHQRDLNLEFYDFIFTERYLLRVRDALTPLQDVNHQSGTTARVFWQQRALAMLPFLAREVPRAKSRLRSPPVYLENDSYARDIRFLHRACEAVSALYFPSKLTLSTFSMQYRTDSIDAMITAASCQDENPFLAVLREHIVPSLSLDTHLFGLSIVYTDQLIPALTVAKEIRRAFSVPIIAGGEVISRMVRTSGTQIAKLFSFFDAIVVDDGSDAILRISESIAAGDPLDNIPQVFTTNNLLNASLTLPREYRLDKLGRPDFDGLLLDRYFSPSIILPALAGKGCEWARCVFCTESFSKQYAPRRTDRLLDDIEYFARRYSVEYVTFADSDIPAETLDRLACGLIERRINIHWSCYARLTAKLTPRLIQVLAASGCQQIYFGLETASQRLLKRMKKGILIDRVPSLLENCRTAGIFSHLFCFTGFPGETREEAWSTANFIYNNIQNIGSFNIGAFSFRTFSEIFDEHDRYGLTPANDIFIDGDADNSPYDVTAGLSMPEAQELARELVSYLSDRMRLDGITHSCHLESGYVIKGQVPPWQSHSLFFLSQSPNTNLALDSSNLFLGDPPPRSTIFTSDLIELSSDRSSRIVFCTNSGKVLRISSRV